MLFLLVPITLVLLSFPVYNAADGVVDVESELPLREVLNPKIQSAPAGPYYQSNQ